MGYGYAKHNVKKCPGTIAKGGCEGKGRPAPGHVYCEKCMRANEAASKAKATDARRAAAHRALDRVLDAAALRAGQYVSSREWAKGAAGKVIDVNAAGAKIEVHEPWPGSITEYTWRTEFWPKADWGALSSSSTTTEKVDAEAAARRTAKTRAKDAHPDVDAIVAAFKKGGRPAAHVEFDRIARTKKLKDYEALMLAEGFKRELKAQGIKP